MKRLAHRIAVFICWMAWLVPGHGQTLPGWHGSGVVPKPPEFGIRDSGDVLNKESGAFQRISDQLRKLEADHGYQILLVVEPVLIGTTATILAAELRESWLRDRDGLVVVFEADSRKLGIGRNLEVSPNLKSPGALIPTHETAALITRATKAVDPAQAPAAYIEALMAHLVRESSAYFKRRNTPPPPGRALRSGLLGVGAITLLALTGLGLGWLVRRSTTADDRRFQFQVVDRPERLGAPCGASVTTRCFKPPTKRNH